MSTPKVLLADSDALFRSSVALTLAETPNVRVAQAHDCPTVIQQLQLSPPQLLVVHEDLPGGGMQAVCAAISEQGLTADNCRVLVMSESSDHGSLLRALEAGAHGYLGKDCRLVELLEAVRTVLRGEAFVQPSMLGGLLSDLIMRRRQAGAQSSRLDTLSRQERRVLGLLARGFSQAGIAAELVISPQTARTHIQNVIGKLGVHSRVEAVAMAFEHGLVEAS